jgi:hypothetical protein
MRLFRASDAEKSSVSALLFLWVFGLDLWRP